MNRSPHQLDLFGELPRRDHDTSGQPPPQVAEWLLEHGCGAFTRLENGFLYGVACGDGHLSPEDLRRLSRLHRRVGGRELPSSSLPWERNTKPRSEWR